MGGDFVAERSRYMPGSAEVRLAALSEQAASFEVYLVLTQPQAAERIEYRKQAVRAVLDELHAVLEAARELPSATRTEVDAAIAAAKAALARCGGTRAQTLEEQRRRIADANAEFDGDVVAAIAHARHRFDGATLRALRRHQQARESLDTEMKIAAACGRLLAGRRGRALAERRRELAAQIATLKDQLEERRSRLAEQRERSATLWRELDAELRESVDAVGADLDRLFS